MSDFKITDIVRVDECTDLNEVNNKLSNGWYLLSVGFATEDKESYALYVIGSTKSPDKSKTADELFKK